MSSKHYESVKNMIPCPSHINRYFGINSSSVEIVYRLDGVFSSSKQFRWINSIKCYLENKIKVSFIWIDEFYIKNTTESSGIVYTLKELSELFEEYDIKYPNLFYTNDGEKLYRHISMYARSLYYKGILHVEGVYAGALKLVKALPQNTKTPNKKALWGMAKSIVEYIYKNPDKYKQKLSAKELAVVLSSGGQMRGHQKKMEAYNNREKVFELARLEQFQRKNQKPSPTLIAKELNIARETASRILNSSYTHKIIA